jgi:thiol:disulfide interchange protein DsbD
MWCTVGLLFSLAAGTASAAEPDVLRPEQAFRYEVSATADDVQVRWRIEPGYYLYKERMSYASRTPDVRLGSAVLPDGMPYHDEFFGDMHIFRSEAVVRIPVVERPAGTTALQLELKSQGCADIGLCYPPQSWNATVTLPARGLTGDVPRGGALGGLLGLGASAGVDDAPLPPEKAFRAYAELTDTNTVQITWGIAEGYYLYRDSLKASSETSGVALGPLQIPRGEPKEDEYFGETEVFYLNATARATLTGTVPAEGLRLRIAHQGCKENSICYPPQTLAMTVSPAVASSTDAPVMVSEQDRLASLIATSNLGLVMATFAGLGLLLSFTPCCLPMVPILSGIIVGHGASVTTRRAFVLSLTYVLGMAVTYTAAGAGFAAAGQQIQATLQQPWIIIGVSLLFIALSLAMFGFYELQLPAGLLNRLTAASNRQRAGTLAGTAAMGALSALVVTTCVAPPLVGALSFIAQSGDITRGALSLFAMSIGMGLPLLAIGASAGRFLPRTGTWMTAVKQFFGLLLLGLAIWMMDRILPDGLTMVLWAALALLTAVLLGATRKLESGASLVRQAGRAVGLVAALYAVALLVGAWSGASNPLQPLERVRGQNASAENRLPFQRIKTVAELEQALAGARGRPAMLDFYADWCVSCIEMERYTFPEAPVRQALGDTLLLQADVTANDAADQTLLNHFGIFGPPTIVFFDRDGRERQGARVVGFMPAGKFAAHVRRANGS